MTQLALGGHETQTHTQPLLHVSPEHTTPRNWFFLLLFLFSASVQHKCPLAVGCFSLKHLLLCGALTIHWFYWQKIDGISAKSALSQFIGWHFDCEGRGRQTTLSISKQKKVQYSIVFWGFLFRSMKTPEKIYLVKWWCVTDRKSSVVLQELKSKSPKVHHLKTQQKVGRLMNKEFCRSNFNAVWKTANLKNIYKLQFSQKRFSQISHDNITLTEIQSDGWMNGWMEALLSLVGRVLFLFVVARWLSW